MAWGYLESTEKLAKQLIANNVIRCASIRRSTLGNYWMCDCTCSNVYQGCIRDELAVKCSRVASCLVYDFMTPQEENIFVSQSMITEYGSEEEAIVHIREMRR